MSDSITRFYWRMSDGTLFFWLFTEHSNWTLTTYVPAMSWSQSCASGAFIIHSVIHCVVHMRKGSCHHIYALLNAWKLSCIHGFGHRVFVQLAKRIAVIKVQQTGNRRHCQYRIRPSLKTTTETAIARTGTVMFLFRSNSYNICGEG